MMNLRRSLWYLKTFFSPVSSLRWPSWRRVLTFLQNLSVKLFTKLFSLLKCIKSVFHSLIGAPCHISGQHSFGGSAAPLHMLSIPGQVFVFCYPQSIANIESMSLGSHWLSYFVSLAGEFRKLLAAFVSGSTSKSSGIVRKITPTSAEPKDTQVANRSQQKLQVSLWIKMMWEVNCVSASKLATLTISQLTTNCWLRI